MGDLGVARLRVVVWRIFFFWLVSGIVGCIDLVVGAVAVIWVSRWTVIEGDISTLFWCVVWIVLSNRVGLVFLSRKLVVLWCSAA